MPNPPTTVQRIHFEDFGGTEFERLAFAYQVRAGWADVAWYGQTGSDQGRDIVGNQLLDDGTARRTIVQCVNRGTLTQTKAKHDMQRAVAASAGRIDAFRFIVRGNVSATRRDAVQSAAQALGIVDVAVWSGVEFEEHLRLIGADLLRRFCDGESFPDAADDLQKFVDDFAGYSDRDVLKAMTAVLDRPAFRTPFHEESSIPSFQRAIEDTIAAFNTGVWRTREGDEIRRIPSLHHLRNPAIKSQVVRVVQQIDKLRRTFVAGIRAKTIRPCRCSQPECPVFMVDQPVARELDRVRQGALDAFRMAWGEFDVNVD